MRMGCASTIDGESVTTLELDVTFPKPVREAKLDVVTEVVKSGKTTGIVEWVITAEEDASSRSYTTAASGSEARHR